MFLNIFIFAKIKNHIKLPLYAHKYKLKKIDNSIYEFHSCVHLHEWMHIYYNNGKIFASINGICHSIALDLKQPPIHYFNLLYGEFVNNKMKEERKRKIAKLNRNLIFKGMKVTDVYYSNDGSSGKSIIEYKGKTLYVTVNFKEMIELHISGLLKFSVPLYGVNERIDVLNKKLIELLDYEICQELL